MEYPETASLLLFSVDSNDQNLPSFIYISKGNNGYRSLRAAFFFAAVAADQLDIAL
jgi:hypothetical protein